MGLVDGRDEQGVGLGHGVDVCGAVVLERGGDGAVFGILQDAGHMLPLSHAGTLGALVRGHFANAESGVKQAA